MSDKNSASDILKQTITKIDGAYAHATIRAYRADFTDFIHFCEERSEIALPAEPISVVEYIIKLTSQKKSSASIRRAIAGIASIHKLNRFENPTQDPDVMLEMRRMHRKLGRASKQAPGITADLLEKMLEATGKDIRGIRDRALLLTAYDTLSRRSELVSLRIEDIKTQVINGNETTSILLRKSKTDQDSSGRWLHLSTRTQDAIVEWIKTLNEDKGALFRGITRGQHAMRTLGSGQINRIYKRIARMSDIGSDLNLKISGHSMRVGHAQDLVNSGASLPIIMTMGRWSKADTVMRYVEQIKPLVNESF